MAGVHGVHTNLVRVELNGDHGATGRDPIRWQCLVIWNEKKPYSVGVGLLLGLRLALAHDRWELSTDCSAEEHTERQRTAEGEHGEQDAAPGSCSSCS